MDNILETVSFRFREVPLYEKNKKHNNGEFRYKLVKHGEELIVIVLIKACKYNLHSTAVTEPHELPC